MRITILTVGSRGDVQPFLALGKGLRAAGHEVTLATHQEWAARIGAAGLGFMRVEGAPHRFMYDEQGQRWMRAGAKPLDFLRRVFPFMVRLLREQLDDAVNACRGADALVFTPLAMAGYHMAEKLGLPCCGASLQPVSPTRCFPSPVLPLGFSFGPLNLLSHILVDRGYAEVWRGEINRWRRERLALPPLPLSFSYSRFGGEQLPLLCGFSSTVVPRPIDWSERLHLAGYWFLDAPGDWEPPDALVDFLEAGPPPVSVGFGSMVVSDAEAVAGLVRQALERAGQRGIVAGSLTVAAGRQSPASILSIDEAPARQPRGCGQGFPPSSSRWSGTSLSGAIEFTRWEPGLRRFLSRGSPSSGWHPRSGNASRTSPCASVPQKSAAASGAKTECKGQWSTWPGSSGSRRRRGVTAGECRPADGTGPQRGCAEPDRRCDRPHG